MKDQEFATKLTAAIAERGWNQSELARRAGMRRDAISTYCRGSAIPSHESLTKLARTLGWTPPKPPEMAARPARKTPRSSVKPGIELTPEPNGGWRLRLDVVVPSLEQATKALSLLSEQQTHSR